jgi:NADH-quinone oxidoreductase subunit C
VSRLSSADEPSDESVETPEAEAEEVDELREGLVARLRDKLGDALVEHHIRPGDDLWVRVDRSAWRQAGEVCRDVLGFDYFCFLSAIDWLPSPWGRGEDDPTEEKKEPSTEIVQGYAGGETRMQVFARLYSTTSKLGITLKADLDDAEPTVDSWTPVYAGADWHEREAWEMYGIAFVGHPDVRHIYLPGGFEGYPLRKDYPLLARMVKPWPGIVDVEAMPEETGDGDAEDDEATEGAAT